MTLVAPVIKSLKLILFSNSSSLVDISLFITTRASLTQFYTIISLVKPSSNSYLHSRCFVPCIDYFDADERPGGANGFKMASHVDPSRLQSRVVSMIEHVARPRVVPAATGHNDASTFSFRRIIRHIPASPGVLDQVAMMFGWTEASSRLVLNELDIYLGYQQRR